MLIVNSGLAYCTKTGTFTRGKKVAGSVYKNGYRYVSFEGTRYRAHRLAFLFMDGEIPEMIDHINGIRDDNSWDNLRATDSYANAHNRNFALRVWETPNGTFRCRVSYRGKRYELGSHATEAIAMAVRDKFLEECS